MTDPCNGPVGSRAAAHHSDIGRALSCDIYLDNAATSFPKPPSVYQCLREHFERYGASPGRGSYRMAREAETMVQETRQLLARLFRIHEPERIVFTLNATDALNMAIKGVVVPTDEVITTVLEHNSVTRPLNRLEHKGLIRVTRVEVLSEGLIDPDQIRRALTARTKLVAVIHGSNVTGAVQPIAAIGRIVREHGALFLVDASQTAGAVPIDIDSSGIDLLAFPGHKALLGPPGTGGLYVGPRAQLLPWREGGTGVQSDDPLQPEDLPYRLEAGSLNTLGLAGLRESIRFILQEGVERIRARESALTKRLLDACRMNDRLHIYGPSALEDRTAVVSLTITGWTPQQAADWLDQAYGIAVRAGLHCAPGAHQALGTFPDGTVRISPGYFTKDTDIDLCLEALGKAADQLTHKGALHPCA